MSQQHYEFGKVNGCVPYGAEYGSEAWIDAIRGAQAAQDEEAARRSAEHMASAQAASQAVPLPVGPGTAGLAPLAMLVVGGYVVWETITQWSRFPVPYKWAAFYYYVLLAVPLKGFGSVWTFLTAPGLTSSSSGNFALGVVGVAAYGFALLVAVMAVWLLLRRKLMLVVFGPAAAALLWMAAHAVWAWATKA